MIRVSNNLQVPEVVPPFALPAFAPLPATCLRDVNVLGTSVKEYLATMRNQIDSMNPDLHDLRQIVVTAYQTPPPPHLQPTLQSVATLMEKHIADNPASTNHMHMAMVKAQQARQGRTQGRANAAAGYEENMETYSAAAATAAFKNAWENNQPTGSAVAAASYNVAGYGRGTGSASVNDMMNLSNEELGKRVRDQMAGDHGQAPRNPGMANQPAYCHYWGIQPNGQLGCSWTMQTGHECRFAAGHHPGETRPPTKIFIQRPPAIAGGQHLQQG